MSKADADETSSMNQSGCNGYEEHASSCLSSLRSLLEKYRDNEIVLDRIHRICMEILPQSIDAYVHQQTDREMRLTKMREERDSFINSFLESYPEYYYFQNTTFVSYDGERYMLASEDHIANRIVTSLSNDPRLACRKHKIKSSIIKRIRERGTSHAVPSSQTIQSVLRPLYPSVFETRNETKYFLTILGDVITKKHSDAVYFVHHRAKEFIDYIISGLTYLKPSSATALSNLFKYRFQNHTFSTSRVIRIQGEGDTLYYPNLNVLDMFFVAQYYSNRYESADNLLQEHNFSNVVQHALVLSNLGTEEEVVKWFASEALTPAHDGVGQDDSDQQPASVDIKMVQYMWKRFCQKMRIPNVVQSSALIPILTSIEPYKSCYDAVDKVFKGYTGNRQYNPSVGLFLEFWNENVFPCPGTESDFDQLEIDEIAIMFNSWVRKRGSLSHRSGLSILDENEMLSCIKHFYPSIVVEDGKYVNGVTCSLWDKQKDVFNYIESQIDLAPDSVPRTADSIYRGYCNRKLRTNLCVASKGYFERAFNHLT